jgi:hypothetical protein
VIIDEISLVNYSGEIMKTKLYIPIFISFLLTIFFAGCYTQIATRDDDYSNDLYDYGYYDNEEEYDSTASSGDYEYEDDPDIVVNKYYFGNYPYYRRYFWGYHPTIIIGIGWNSWYYDPFYCDPFYYWNWCGYPWYYPSYYYSFYNPYYYYPNYWWDWNNYGGSYTYRERSRDTYSIRNNSGLRNSYVTRGDLTRRDSRTLTKETTTRERSRDVLLDRNTTSRNRDLNRDRTDVRNDERTRNKELDKDRTRNQRDENTIRKNPTDRQKEVRKRYENIFKDKSRDNTTTPPRKDDTRRREMNKNDAPNIKKDNSDTRQRTDTRNRNEVRTERRTQETPKSYSPPQRTYSPPTNNTPPPRTSNPPSNTDRSGDRRR